MPRRAAALARVSYPRAVVSVFALSLWPSWPPHPRRRWHGLAVALLAALPLSAQAIEEPDYQVLRTLDAVELRRYAPYVVAEVVVQADPQDAGSLAFPILAGYIFGKNKGEKSFAMTAPVTQTPVPQRLAMTAPVTQEAVAGGYRVQFVLPKGVGLASAPEPLDPRVQLREVPAADWAVIRYSGSWSAANEQEHLARLRATLDAAGLATQGEPVLARYNPPITPWFLRRNEVWLALR